MTRWTRSLLLLLPAAVAFVGLVLFIYGDLTGKHWIRAGGAAIGGAALLMAVAGCCGRIARMGDQLRADEGVPSAQRRGVQLDSRQPSTEVPMRLIGLAVVLSLTLAPLAVEAQPPTEKVWRIGVLMSFRPGQGGASLLAGSGLSSSSRVAKNSAESIALRKFRLQAHVRDRPGPELELVPPMRGRDGKKGARDETR